MKYLTIREEKILQEMFDRMQDLLSDDLVERYDTRNRDKIRVFWHQDVDATHSLASKLNAHFNKEMVLACGEVHLKAVGTT